MSFGAGGTHPSSGANAANRCGNLALAKNGGGTSGTFANAAIDTNLPPGLHTALSYDATHAYLDLLLNFT